MNNIENTYCSYSEIMEEFTEEVIRDRISTLLGECKSFIESIGAESYLAVNSEILTVAVMDYFSDISRLKAFHKIDKVNEIKIVAYTIMWFLRRKPIQIVNPDIEEYVYANEKFALTYIMHYLLKTDMDKSIEMQNKQSYRNFIESLYYYLKFRHVEAQTIELLLLSFKAGQMLD